MKKGYYLYQHNPFDKNEGSSGVGNKVRNQINYINSDPNIHIDLVTYTRSKKTLKTLSKAIFSGNLSFINWPDPTQFKDGDFLYIRRDFYISSSFLNFLKQVKRINPRIKIILEIPTFPYDGEALLIQGLKGRIALLFDKNNRKNLFKHCDYIADLSGEKYIFDIPTIPISNGVNLNEIPIRHPSRESITDTIDVVCAAYFFPWHGIDRFIRGMGEYYSKNQSVKVVLHLIGDGDQKYMGELHSLVHKYNIEKYVEFHAKVPMNELSQFYDQSDIAIESLGVHRRKWAKTSYSIKSREYLAKGIPFIYSTPIDLDTFQEIPFTIKFPESDDSINIDEIASYYKDLFTRISESEAATILRDYASKWATYDHALSILTEKITQFN